MFTTGLSELLSVPSLTSLDLSECLHISGTEIVKGLTGCSSATRARLERLNLKSCTYIRVSQCLCVFMCNCICVKNGQKTDPFPFLSSGSCSFLFRPASWRYSVWVGPDLMRQCDWRVCVCYCHLPAEAGSSTAWLVQRSHRLGSTRDSRNNQVWAWWRDGENHRQEKRFQRYSLCSERCHI